MGVTRWGSCSRLSATSESLKILETEDCVEERERAPSPQARLTNPAVPGDAAASGPLPRIGQGPPHGTNVINVMRLTRHALTRIRACDPGVTYATLSPLRRPRLDHRLLTLCPPALGRAT
jgi:hypothetical protein